MNKKKDLDVLPVVPVESNEVRKIHPNLPQIDRNRGFLLLILGSVNSGKSTILANMLMGSQFYVGKNPFFDGRTCVFSP